MALPFVNFYRLGVPEQALGGIHLGFWIVVEDKPFEFLRLLDSHKDLSYAHVQWLHHQPVSDPLTHSTGVEATITPNVMEGHKVYQLRSCTGILKFSKFIRVCKM